MSQHNRYDFDYVVVLLKHLNNLGRIEIYLGDSKNVQFTPNIRKYVELVRLISGDVDKGSLDSIKKNIFPDFHRMNLINRYNEKGVLTDPYKKQHIKYVEISDLGKKLINDEYPLKDRYFWFSQQIEKISKGYIHTLKDLMVELDMNSITCHEMTIFTSGINETFSGVLYSYDDIKGILCDWNRLSRIQKNAVVQAVENWCDEHFNDEDPKNLQRDFDNWKNESQQTMCLFSQTPFFEPKGPSVLLLKFGKSTSMYGSVEEAKRSVEQKNKYFEYHNIVSKMTIFRLHHIIPLFEAKTITEYKMLDCWENMIYINSDKHAEIHGKDKLKCYRLKIFNNDIEFISLLDPNVKINAVYKENAVYNTSLTTKILEKNNQLLFGTK